MNQQSHTRSPEHTAEPHDRHARDEGRTLRGKRMVGEILRGGVFSAVAYLFGSATVVFGAAPLGIALLAAASSYTWYILAGLLLAAILHPASLVTWAWVGVYLFCIVLRLCIRFFVDPPTVGDGRPLGGRAYLRLCFSSVLRNIGFGESEDDDTSTDYYDGEGRARTSSHTSTGAARPSTRGEEMHLFAEHPFLRMLTAAVGGFAAGVISLFSGHFHVYDLLTLFSFIILSPLATFLLVSCFGESGQILLFSPTPLRDAPLRSASVRGKSLSDRDGGVGQLGAHFHALPLLSVCFLLAAAVFAARERSVALGTPYLTLELATILGLMFSLLASARLGVIPGVAVAILCGLAADPRLSPVFILCAGGYALLRYISHRVGVIGGCVIGAVWCGTVEGVSALILHLPSIALTVPIFFVCEKLWTTLPAGGRRTDADRELEDFTTTVTAALTAETRAEAQRTRLKALSETFGTLSRHFSDLSSQLKRPRMPELRRVCDEAFGKHCAHCRERETCWGVEYDRTLEVQNRLASRLHDEGRADMDDLSPEWRDFCPHAEEIVDDINTRYAHMSETLYKSEKTEVIAADYAAISAILHNALEEDRAEAENMDKNRETADRIYAYLSEMDVRVLGVVVCGKRERRLKVIVRGVGLDRLRETAREVRRHLEDICGTRLTLPTFEAGEDKHPSMVMTLYSEERIRTSYAGGTVPAGTRDGDVPPSPVTDRTPEGGYGPPAVCGDHIALFKTDNAYFYALISDGMGSGEDASLTSDVCTMFLQKMLTAGNRVEVSLRMLDGYLRSKNTGTGNECSATVDLMELDLMDGHAVFAKNGAAPTYVVREGTVYKLRSRTMPMGILKDTPPDLLRFRMHPGDVVVMVSDGVTLGNDECPWLIDLLSSPMPPDMDDLRTDIIRRALSAGSEDDLSAIAIRVEDKG